MKHYRIILNENQYNLVIETLRFARTFSDGPRRKLSLVETMMKRQYGRQVNDRMERAKKRGAK